MSAASKPTAIRLPPQLAEAFEKAVSDYAAVTGEPVEECRRVIEVAIITRGMRALREQIEAEKKHAERMGWK